MDSLPAELTFEIFLAAVRYDNLEERREALNIALVSRTVFRLVRPTLYRVLQLTEQNCLHFQPENISLYKDTVLPYVQYMAFHVKGAMQAVMRIDPHSHTSMLAILDAWNPTRSAFLDASWDYIEHFATNRPDAFRCLRGMDVSFIFLSEAVDKMETEYQHTALTHLVGYVPDDLTAVKMRDWAARIAAAQPHLTHLGLRIKRDRLDGGDLTLEEHVGALKAAILLFYERLEGLEIVMVQAGRYYATDIQAQTAFTKMVQAIGRGDIVVWFEPSSLLETDPEFDDNFCGRDFWTQCSGRRMLDIHGRLTLD